MEQRGGCILSLRLSMAAESSDSAGAMSDVWKAPPVLMTRAWRQRALVASSHILVMASLVPATVNPAGNRRLAIWHTGSLPLSAAMAFSQIFSNVGRSSPATEAMLCGLRAVAFCIASALIFTSFRHSAKGRMSAAQIAVYSPRLRPATALQRSTCSFLSVAFMSSTAAMPAMNITGWQYLVSASLESGPLRQSSKTSQPRIFFASANMLFTAGKSLTSFNMPTFCEPCPGNMRQTGSGGFAL
mmetsp:Transcript_134886/g.238635  ORF Transcript_134886/g.238635 Transcript_134886/m.238635 type:complete len:243 (-) Transcript_134886:862-1590(-)